MLSPEIHPRFLERIRGIGEGREQDIMDKQVRVYCQLRKAAEQLQRAALNGADASPFSGLNVEGRKAEKFCETVARAVRQQALGADTSQAKLLAICTDMERLSESILRALGDDSPA